MKSNEILFFFKYSCKAAIALQSLCSSRWKLVVNFVVCRDLGLEFFAKAKPLTPKAKATKFGLKATAKEGLSSLVHSGAVIWPLVAIILSFPCMFCTRLAKI